MDKAIKEHDEYIKQQLMRSNRSEADTEALLRYHEDQLHHFLHERLIHLLVTFFFGGLAVTSAILAVSTSFSDSFGVLSPLLSLLVFILLIVEVFYIIYYFKLENGIQRLYRYEKELHDIKK